jgi:hypothetical protein
MSDSHMDNQPDPNTPHNPLTEPHDNIPSTVPIATSESYSIQPQTLKHPAKKGLLISLVLLCVIILSVGIFVFKPKKAAPVPAVTKTSSTDQDLPFAVYKPSYIPAGYSFDASGTDTGSGFVSSGSSRTPYFTLSYAPDNDNNGLSSFIVRSSVAPSWYNPPQDCGGSALPESPGDSHNKQDCTLAGHSAAGCDVYLAVISGGNSQLPGGSNHQAYCKIGGTLVTLSSSNIVQDGKTLLAAPADSEIVKVFDSLVALNATQVQALDQHNQ